METRQQIELTYDRTKDTLYIQSLSPRPARSRGFEFDFYVQYDWNEPSKKEMMVLDKFEIAREI